MGAQESSRLSLADDFFAIATGEAEAAVRSSLSRLYYAAYHVAAALTDGRSHGDIAKRLEENYGEVGSRFGKMHDLRSQMDYRPDFFKAMGVKDIGIWYRERMQEGTAVYYELRKILEGKGR